VDLRRFPFFRDTRAARESLGLGLTDTILLSVRRLVPRTGVLRLVEAFAELKQPGRRLIIVGEGPQRTRIRRRIRQLGLGDCVSLLGHVPDEDLALYYQAADLSVVPSLGLEAFGLVILESMACGTPVATTAVGGARAIVGELDRRLVLPSVSSSGIASGLQRLLEGCDLQSLRPRTRQLVEGSYSLEHMGRRLCSLLEDVP
jgi:glycosyltransferase involved in cell wall biosynthesis